MQTKQELIKYLEMSNCYDFLNSSSTEHKDLDVVLPSSVGENLKRIERIREDDEQVTAVWHFPSIDAYVKFEGEQSSYDGTECNNLYLVVPEEYTAVRFNKVVEIKIDSSKLIADIESYYNRHNVSDGEPVDIIGDFPYVTNVNEIENYDRDEYGAEAHRIIEVTVNDGEKYVVKVDGYYSSYSGFSFETCKIVTKKEKTVTVYE
jgi:hypothetical protein